MTMTRWAVPATTPKSWVIRRIDPLRSWLISARVSSTCTVTSSAVVGSSAISTAGSSATAMAIITRWRMPPESSWGNESARRAGSGMPTRSSNSTARRRATPRPTRSWARIVSAIWAPTRCSGCRPVRASWKIMAISAPLISRRRAGVAPLRSSPLNSTCPPVMRPVRRGSSPRIDSANIVLPQPDSPTTASTSSW